MIQITVIPRFGTAETMFTDNDTLLPVRISECIIYMRTYTGKIDSDICMIMNRYTLKYINLVLPKHWNMEELERFGSVDIIKSEEFQNKEIIICLKEEQDIVTEQYGTYIKKLIEETAYKILMENLNIKENL